jgi:signal transduction histidine kinase
MVSKQKIHPAIESKLKKAVLFDLANRNRKTGVFHIFAFGVAIYFSALRELQPTMTAVLFAFIVFAVGIRTYITFPKVQDRFKDGAWLKSFQLISCFIFSIWSFWYCSNIYSFGVSMPVYFNSILISGLCVNALMGFSPSLTLMYSIILITVIPGFLMLLGHRENEGIQLGALMGLNIIYLISISKKNNQHYVESVINKELADQNRNVIEGVLNSIPGLVSCVDYEMNYVWTNRRLNEKIGLNISDKIKTVGSYKPDEKFPVLVREFVNSGKEFDQFEYQMSFPDGAIWMNIYLSKYDEFGYGRVLIVAFDINASKLAEVELEKQRLVAAESSKLATLGEMSAGIAHEINNPLSVMMGRTDLMLSELKEGTVEPELLINNLEKVLKASERIAKIVKGLKTFSRKGENDEFQKTKVEAMVNDVLDFTLEKFKQKKVELKLDLDPELSVNCRSTQIEQVILNLLGNGFDAISETPNPWVKVEAKSVGSRAIISVTDSGNGIPEAIVSKMMQPFYTTKEVGKGTGLGLSISLGIIKTHKGEFYYDSKSPNTRFVIDLPKVD